MSRTPDTDQPSVTPESTAHSPSPSHTAPPAAAPSETIVEEKTLPSYYSSIEGLLDVSDARRKLPSKEDARIDYDDVKADNNSQAAETLFEEGLLQHFKKQYEQAQQCLEEAYRAFIQQRHYLGAAKSQIELAWLRYNQEAGDGIAKSGRFFAEAQQLVLAHSNQPGMSNLRGRLLHYQGLVKYREGQFGEAVKLFKKAHTFCQPNGLDAAKLLDSLAIYYERIGDYPRALKNLRSSLALKQRVAPAYEQAITSQILGRLYLLLEDTPMAREALEMAMQLSAGLNDDKRVASIKNDLIKLHIQSGELELATEAIHVAEQDNLDKQLWSHYGMTLLYKSFILFRRREFQDCREFLNQIVQPILQKHNLTGFGISRRLLGALEYQLGNPSQAIDAMGDAIYLFQEQANMVELAKTHFEFGRIYLDLGNKSLALNSLREALKIAEQNGMTFLSGHIEDEIFRLDETEWLAIVDKRANHQPVFSEDRTLYDVLSSLSQEEGDLAAENGQRQTRSLISMLRVGQAVAGERDISNLLSVIKDETERALDADRCTVFLYDRERNELWSKVASGLKNTQEIRFPAHKGLAGYVVKTGEVLNIRDAYADPRFNQEVDKKTGYRTRNLLCIPIRNRKMDIIGVFQVLNKRNGCFEKADEDLLLAIAATAGVSIDNAMMAAEQQVAFDSFIKTLSSTIDARDPITAGHSQRVADYALLLGERMHLTYNEKEALKYASLLHDIGKIGIKEEILVKDGRLTEAEYRHIQKHAFYTYEILKNIHFERHLADVPEIAAAHHERMDGKGYFRQLKGAEIPLSGRMLALSDVFDAITSRRHYRNRMPFERVLMILRRDSGAHFDPDCVESFFGVSLYDLCTILVSERNTRVEPFRAKLIKDLDKSITLREFETLLGKEKMTKAEANLSQLFSAIYYVNPVREEDKY
ncbi:MAG: tetratricopeptide repeat protein [Candidatus Melainabacteria bacterium]|nr:tetratricopeptide repeat protein [Candidatus Melainabacteria bacterium]